MRLRKKHLKHRVTIERLAGETAEGTTYASPVADIPAYVEQKSRLVVDRRTSSATTGTEIVSSAFVVLLVQDDVLPASYVTYWPGTPREKRTEVISSALFDYDGTPSHIELYLE